MIKTIFKRVVDILHCLLLKLSNFSSLKLEKITLSVSHKDVQILPSLPPPPKKRSTIMRLQSQKFLRNKQIGIPNFYYMTTMKTISKRYSRHSQSQYASNRKKYIIFCQREQITKKKRAFFLKNIRMFLPLSIFDCFSGMSTITNMASYLDEVETGDKKQGFTIDKVMGALNIVRTDRRMLYM